MRKAVKTVIVGLPLTILLFVAILLGIKIFNTETPEVAMKMARNGISQAVQCNSHILEPLLYQQAEELYYDAMVEWQNQNEKSIFKRNFEHIILLANKSVKLSTEACAKSKTKAINEKTSVQKLFAFWKKKKDKFNGATQKFPLSKSNIKDYHTGDLLMREASNLLEEGDFIKARIKLEKASVIFSKIIASTHAYLKNYYSSFPGWAKDAEEGIQYSRSNNTIVLLIDKIAHQCYVYKNGKVVQTFGVDMGKNWIGQKTREGDNATPEGSYKILEKKMGKKTIYYRALLLDYPNQKDFLRISHLKGSKKPRLGGLIEIHGEGGKDLDWTKGCIALANDDMDKLFSLVAVGTKVVIVGSLLPFSEIENKYFE